MGEGPVLHVDQTKLEWGTIPVLQPVVKILRISNESCIDANYNAKLVSPFFFISNIQYKHFPLYNYVIFEIVHCYWLLT